MRAMRPHELDTEAPELSRTRSLAPLAAAGTLFLLGVFGIMGVLPFTGGLVGDQARSPGHPLPLVQPRPVNPPEPNLDGINVPPWRPFELPLLVRAAAEAEVLASSAGNLSGVNAIQAIPPTPTPAATATPTSEPTAAEEEVAEAHAATPEPTATQEGHFVPEEGSAQEPAGQVVGILSSEPQPTPPGPVREQPLENPGED